MLKRKQVLTLATIAVTSFLIGTIFSAMATEGGNPFEKIWETITGLQSEMETLEDRIETLEEQSLPQGFMNAPAYDSGWVVEYSPGSIYKTFEHGLNTTDVLVYIVRNDTNRGINQVWYGENVWFNLTENEITLEMPSLPYPSGYIRVMIWKISEPT